jgi:hypothetical protein
MGVKTRVFGKYAWLFLQGMARMYDDALDNPELDHRSLTLLMQEVMFLMGFVLPCVYCRISYREFTDPAHPCNAKCDINNMLGTKNGAKQLVYHLQKRVGYKLRDQERDKAEGDKGKLGEINSKWKEYDISFHQALKSRFPDANGERFWRACISFLALVMCDWRPADVKYIHRYFEVIGRLFSLCHHRPFASLYQEWFESSKALWETSMNLDTRLDMVWSLQCRIFRAQHWEVGCTRKQFGDRCRHAIVGCVSKPTKALSTHR